MTDCAHCGRPTDKRLCHECSLEARFGLPDDDVGVDAELDGGTREDSND